jgi:glycosyltransferase involved in cell wall biosynthesis
VVTVLDLIYHHFPDTFPLASRLGLRAVVPLGARRADRVIAISAAARDDIVATLGLPPGKVEVVHLGFGMPPSPRVTNEGELRARLGLGRSEIVLTVSAALRHKNLEGLLEAFGRVASGHDARLVVAGHAGLEQERLERQAAALGLAGRVLFTGWIEQPDLEGLFAAARVFAYPSLMEGFGMPVLEAMARGVPVACSAVSALPEVAGDAAELFDPRDPAAIAAAIERLLDDPARRSELVARGRARPAEFTWERAARGTLESYRRAIRSRESTSRQ